PIRSSGTATRSSKVIKSHRRAQAIGVWLHLTEDHEHEHSEPMAHGHPHVHDEHHQHSHAADDPSGEPHTHFHQHARLRHTHSHAPTCITRTATSIDGYLLKTLRLRTNVTTLRMRVAAAVHMPASCLVPAEPIA